MSMKGSNSEQELAWFAVVISCGLQLFGVDILTSDDCVEHLSSDDCLHNRTYNGCLLRSPYVGITIVSLGHPTSNDCLLRSPYI